MMVKRYELRRGDNNCDLCCMDPEPDGDWVAYSDYAEAVRLYIELVDGINALGFGHDDGVARVECAPEKVIDDE
jgi:hypothetical protein